jgi:protein AbiQ
MKWYTVEENFLKYLRSHEKRVPQNDYGEDRFKPFFGALFEVGDLVYISQVSHAKPRHAKIKENLDFIKLYDKKRLLAVVNLNYMFPVPKSKLIEVEYKNIESFRTFNSEIEKGKYIYLLKKERKELQSRSIGDKALYLYSHKYDYPNDIVSLRCFDFKELEQKCLEYIQ